jgi:hypothetical protein
VYSLLPGQPASRAPLAWAALLDGCAASVLRGPGLRPAKGDPSLCQTYCKAFALHLAINQKWF